MDTFSLFLHVLAAIGLISGGVVQVLAGVRLRAADTGRDVATWARFARGAGALIIGSAVVSLLTGGHLAAVEPWTTDATSGFERPFVVLGLVGLLVLGAVGPMMGGARLRRLAEAADSVGDDPAPGQLLADARSPALWGPVHSLPGVGVGLVALMVYKPDWAAGAVVLVALFAAGWGAGAALASRGATAPPPRPHRD